MYYKYSELYKQNSVDKQLKIEYDGGVITNNELYSESFELTESLCSETNLKFGTCEASVLKFKIANVVESLKGKWLTVTETLAGNENIPFQFGKYKVYSDVPSADRNYRDVTAYDSMYDILNADMTEWWNSTTGSATIRYLRISFLDYFGIECEDIELPNDNMVFQFSPAESMSGKDIVNAICELNGCFGHIGRDGKFYFIFLDVMLDEIVYSDGNLYPNNNLYPVSSFASSLQSRCFDGRYKIIDGYFYFRIYGKFIYKGSSSNVENYAEGSYEARFKVTNNGINRACIRWKSGFYRTHDDETYYSPEFHWIDGFGYKQVDNDVYPEIDFDGDGTFGYQKTIYVREEDFRYISGVPVFETDDELYDYLGGKETTHYINWDGMNEVEKSRCISGKYEDYEVKKIDCVQIRNEENDIGAVAGDGENIYIIEDCFLCYGKSSTDLQTIVNNIYNAVKNISYLPYEAEVLGNPCLEVGNRVRINARNKTIESYILKRTIRGIQGLRDNYSATGEEKQNKKVNSVSKSIIQLKKRTNTLTRTVDETISEIYSYDESGEKVSRIQQNAEAIALEVTRATGKETELSSRIELTEQGIESKVEKGEIISTINQSAEAVTINADKINLNGNVTANGNVSFGTDGKITAKEANISGTIEATTLKADKAFYIVDTDFDTAVKVIAFVSDSTSDTKYRVGRLTENDYSEKLNFISFNDVSQERSIVFNTGNINFNGAGIASDLKISTFKLRGGDKDTDLMYCNTDKSAYFGPQSTLEGYTSYFRGETVRLVGANGVYLGSSGSTAVSSDEKLKDLFEIDERYEKFFDLLEPVLYTYKEVGHRKHVGIGARHVKDCLDKAGISTEDFAGLIIETDVTIGEEENQQHYDELYSIRYEEFVMLNTMKIKKLEKRVEVLENALTEQNELIRSLMERIEKLEG